MKPLAAQIILIAAIFLLLLIVLGAQFGTLEISIWLIALIGLIFFTVRRHRRNSGASNS
ncbi:hypothetical protein ACFWXK_01865 [Streptomyces sp. NPDC059070]|uniref:hypothetical protein n=1 Tax=unclassified Streptomyces TaxID=2593676 RepID=UPI0034E2557F